jgi:hypothetical protein
VRDPNVVAVRDDTVFKANHRDDVENAKQERFLNEVSSMRAGQTERLHGAVGKLIDGLSYK